MGTYSCNVCGNSFRFQQDVEKHLSLNHQDHIEVENRVRMTSQGPSQQERNQGPGPSHQESDESDILQREIESQLLFDVDEPDEEDDFVFKLKKLKEGVFPLRFKIRQGNAWPELRKKINKDAAESLMTESNHLKARLGGILEEIKHFALWNNMLKTVEVTMLQLK